MKITNLYPESQTLEREVSDFLTDWNNNELFILANTSGSTGKPKVVKLMKSRMEESARMTGEFFEMEEGQNALLVLSPRYIAGKMMIVRALIHNMNLFLGKVSSLPFDKLDTKIHIAAMIPTQVRELLRKNVSFECIEHLIIGGAVVDYNLQSNLSSLSTKCYATFGMTETLSHIALSMINSNELVYKSLPGVRIGITDEHCLKISAPLLLTEDIITNDVVDLVSEDEFVWKGRADFVINSGGVKLHPEIIERKLKPYIEVEFFILSELDDKFGELVVLYIESTNHLDLDSIFKVLDKFERPKKVYYKKSFVYTESGKLNRIKTIE